MLNGRWTLISFFICAIIVICTRLNYHSNNEINGYNATTWDALGYYIYLPSSIIYHDISDLDWFKEVDEKYQLSGGSFYQATELENGNHVFKYLGGVAIMQAPFFLAAHAYASVTDYPPDGFSAPYQYAIIWGAIFWFIIALWFLKKLLSKFYTDQVVGITLLLLVGATNLLQYVSIDGAMSHSFIFPLYVFLLWMTYKWHNRPNYRDAFFIGLVIGLATISRPTELIMIFIPLLWGIDSREEISNKIKLIKKNKRHVFLLVLGGLIGVLPQLIYWKIASGDWIYNVGSKWFFLNPWWRVLFGFEKGWFIYTPIAIFMVLGFFFIQNKIFKNAVIIFCLLNIWIIISWSDWRYGATYSARALTHSYPVFALALGGIIERLYMSRSRLIFGAVGLYLLATNGVQIWQYNAGILHYNDMNRKYYGRIYWDFAPSSLDYSLMDSETILSKLDLSNFQVTNCITFDSTNINLSIYESIVIAEIQNPEADYLINKFTINAFHGFNEGFILVREFKNDSILKETKFRLALPYYGNGKNNEYEHHYKIQKDSQKTQVLLESFGTMKIEKVQGEVTIGSLENDH
jgi:hypothetical protein